jgi:hypothetical protein
MFTVELYAKIRLAVMVDRLSRREAAKRFGVHRNTITKMLSFSVPPGYRRREEAGALYGVDRRHTWRRPPRSQEAAAHGARAESIIKISPSPATSVMLSCSQLTSQIGIDLMGNIISASIAEIGQLE